MMSRKANDSKEEQQGAKKQQKDETNINKKITKEIFKKEITNKNLNKDENVKPWPDEKRTSGDGSECVEDPQEEEKKNYIDSLKHIALESVIELLKPLSAAAATTKHDLIMAKLDEIDNKLECKVSAKQLEDMFRKWHGDPTNDVQGQDTSHDNKPMGDLICKVKGCKCPWHRDNRDKNSRRTYKYHHTNLLPRNNLRTRRKFTLRDAGVDWSSIFYSNFENVLESSFENVSDSLHKHEGNRGMQRMLTDDSVVFPNATMGPVNCGAGGGGSSGDDSSFESDSDSLHKLEEHIPSKRKLHRAEDIKQWDNAIDEHDSTTIKELMKSGNFPKSDQIRHACEVFGRGSGVVTGICRDVSRWIRDQDEYIVGVEPAYEPTSEGDVTFIIYLRQHENDLNYNDLRFKVLVRVIGQYNSEGKDIVGEEVKKHLKFTLEDANTLSKCLEKHSKPLMEKHSNLQMISASHFKSKNYGNENLEKTMCIVFYVKVKGFIPLTEERLPKDLDGIPTDIREGGFEFLSNARDRHTHLKIGCEIAGAGKTNFSGTLGPFLEHDGNIYCLTAAHVLYGVPQGGKPGCDWPSMKFGDKKVDVFQPNPNRFTLMSEPFGSVYLAKYKQGGSDVSGIDVAVILVQDKSRWPISGEFPESEEGSNMEEEGDDDGNAVHTLTYNTGEICERDFLTNNNAVEVLKFGSVTGETRGLLRLAGTSVRYDDCLNDCQGVLLYKQIEITKSVEDRIFADNGDSGAVVLVSYCGNRHHLKALALLIGRSSTGTVIATPMYAIFDELKLTNRNFMSFQKRNVNQSISTDSGLGQLASPTAADIQRELEETFLKPRFKLIEKTMAENKNETTAVRSEVVQLRSETTAVRSEVVQLHSDLNSKFDGIMQMLKQVLPQSQSGNGSDSIQKNGN